jgi:hypothetical protein
VLPFVVGIVLAAVIRGRREWAFGRVTRRPELVTASLDA